MVLMLINGGSGGHNPFRRVISHLLRTQELLNDNLDEGRHAASNALDREADIAKVQEWLGRGSAISASRRQRRRDYGFGPWPSCSCGPTN